MVGDGGSRKTRGTENLLQRYDIRAGVNPVGIHRYTGDYDAEHPDPLKLLLIEIEARRVAATLADTEIRQPQPPAPMAPLLTQGSNEVLLAQVITPALAQASALAKASAPEENNNPLMQTNQAMGGRTVLVNAASISITTQSMLSEVALTVRMAN